MELHQILEFRNCRKMMRMMLWIQLQRNNTAVCGAGCTAPFQADDGCVVGIEDCKASLAIRNYKGSAESDGEGVQFHFAACLPFGKSLHLKKFQEFAYFQKCLLLFSKFLKFQRNSAKFSAKNMQFESVSNQIMNIEI